jgi:hypothetical protein
MIGQVQKQEKPQYDRVLYIGTAVCHVAGVNVDDAMFESIMGYKRKETFSPLVSYQDDSGRSFLGTQFEVIFKTVPSLNNNIDTTFLRRFIVFNYKSTSKTGKVQAIDRFGRDCWITPQELMQTSQPLIGLKRDGSKFLRQIEAASMRQAYRGEAQLMQFLSALLFNEDVSKFEKQGDRHVYVGEREDKEKYLCRVDNIEKFFNGQLNEVLAPIAMAKENMVKICVGIQENDGKFYQRVHDCILRPYENTKKLERALIDGAKYDNTKYETNSLHVYLGANSNTDIEAITSEAKANVQATSTENDLPF